jgi:hypothetical protein
LDDYRIGRGALTLERDELNPAEAALNCMSNTLSSLLSGDEMLPVIAAAPPVMAIGYSLLYLLFGGGFGGAVIIFIIAKMLRK